MKTIKLLPAVEINPAQTADKCIIWLHGLGADGNDFAPIVPELNMPAHLNIRFIFPHAPVMPVSINNGYEMPAWFDIYGADISKRIDMAGIEQSMQRIMGLIQHETTRGILPANIILAGFSQGAVMALTTGLLHPERLGGIIALSGLLPHASELGAKSPHQHLPIFMAHGTSDQIVPFPLGRTASDDLTLAAYPVEWHQYPMGHSVCHEEIQDISRWIQKIWT